MAASGKGLVLVTGANGFIAAKTVEAFLKAGYNVRGTVRSVASGKAIQEVLGEYVKSGKFEIVIVSDITQPGAFDTAIKGCHAIAHLAAPVSLSFTDPVPVIHGAVNGTKTLLEGAHKHGKDLKTVVLMSSIVAVVSPREQGHVYTEKDWNEHSESEVTRLGKSAASIDIYAASKTLAERAFWEFRDEHRTTFAMTAINPALVWGPPLLLTSDPGELNETVRDIWTILSGQPIPPTKGTGTMVDVRDVARLFVFAVDHPLKTNGERYLAVGGAGPNQEVTDILRENYPTRRSIIQEGSPGEGYIPNFDIFKFVDASKAVKTTGVPFISLKDSVLAAAEAFERYF